MKQFDLFGNEIIAEQSETKYTKKIEAPVYTPRGDQPHPMELYNSRKSSRLIAEIKSQKLEKELERFLIAGAMRHTVFNYERIADYYASAPPEVQLLMERSAMVIIDFDKAIELGFVKLADELRNQYLSEYDIPDEE